MLEPMVCAINRVDELAQQVRGSGSRLYFLGGCVNGFSIHLIFVSLALPMCLQHFLRKC